MSARFAIFILTFVVSPITLASMPQSQACLLLEQIQMGMDVTASNIANVWTTRIPEGGPYRIKKYFCIDGECKIQEEPKNKIVYEPGHPDADQDGYVTYPDTSLLHEMEDMIRLSSEYEEALSVCMSQSENLF